MSFRDDHDAAIARIDALEGEVAELRGENERLEREVSKLRRTIAGEDVTVHFTPESSQRPMPAWIATASWLLGMTVFAMLALIIILGATAPA